MVEAMTSGFRREVGECRIHRVSGSRRFRKGDLLQRAATATTPSRGCRATGREWCRSA